MPIPETQLETWSHQGAMQGSSDTYNTVKTALESSKAVYAGKDCKVFLQGSYGNDTDIHTENDVDAVIRLDSIYGYDMSALPPAQQAAFQQAFIKAIYPFDEFKRGVVLRLETAFGKEDVEAGNKAVKIKPNGSRRSADVVVCYEYRRYIRFISPNNWEYVPGIIFPSGGDGTVVNYPKLHSENCTTKHQATDEWFKPMVRILKNMRSRLVDDGKIAKDTAPSYYIEGMLWNVPDGKFGESYQDSFINSINWLKDTDRSKLLCANEQYLLLGNSNVQWTSAKCDAFLLALIVLWNGWGN
jgi:hypothetical protein